MFGIEILWNDTSKCLEVTLDIKFWWGFYIKKVTTKSREAIATPSPLLNWKCKKRSGAGWNHRQTNFWDFATFSNTKKLQVVQNITMRRPWRSNSTSPINGCRKTEIWGLSKSSFETWQLKCTKLQVLLKTR